MQSSAVWKSVTLVSMIIPRVGSFSTSWGRSENPSISGRPMSSRTSATSHVSSRCKSSWALPASFAESPLSSRKTFKGSLKIGSSSTTTIISSPVRSWSGESDIFRLGWPAMVVSMIYYFITCQDVPKVDSRFFKNGLRVTEFGQPIKLHNFKGCGNK